MVQSRSDMSEQQNYEHARQRDVAIERGERREFGQRFLASAEERRSGAGNGQESDSGNRQPDDRDIEENMDDIGRPYLKRRLARGGRRRGSANIRQAIQINESVRMTIPSGA